MSKTHRSIGHGFIAWFSVGAALTLAYALVFLVTETLVGAGDIALWSVSNALPQVTFAVPLVDRVAPWLTRRRPAVAVSAFAATVLLYALASYCALIFLLAATGGVRAEGILVRFFSGPALPWQIFQGCAYGCIAILAGLWLDARRRLQAVSSAQLPGQPTGRPQRWLVKTAEGIVPIDPDEIVRIEAAGEYARIVLPTSSTLSRIGMTACEQRLEGLPFLRVHRSHLVHADRIVRAEPAGNGRLQLTLANGDQLITSRDGAKLLRSAAI
jgi:two-component system, LytTR family, response regulator